MDIQVDVSENVRFVDKLSILGACNFDGSEKWHVSLPARVKKRIKGYSSKTVEIHAILCHQLVEDKLDDIVSIQFCIDVSKGKLLNTLRMLFKDDARWKALENNHNISVKPVGKGSAVDKYVKHTRKNHTHCHGCDVSLNQLKSHINKLIESKKKK